MLFVLLVQNTKDRQDVVILMPLKTDTIYWFLKKTKTTCYHQKRYIGYANPAKGNSMCQREKKKKKKTRQLKEI